MVFNKAVLDTTITDTKARIAVIDTERNQLANLLDAMTSLQDEDVIREVDGVPTRVTIVKTDSRTHTDFTSVRQDEIYDANVPLAQTKIIESI